MQYTQHLTIDVFKQEQFQYIHAKQFDHYARQLVIAPTANGEPLTIPSTATAVFRCLKHDGTSVVNPAVVDATAGTITFELTDQALACEGMARADVSIIDGENVISTLTFFIMVEKAPTSSEQIESTNEFLFLIQAAAEAKVNAEHAVASAESAANSASAAASSEEVAVASATTASTKANEAADSAAVAQAAEKAAWNGKSGIGSIVLPAGRFIGDINGDGIVDNNDYLLFINGPTSVGSIPNYSYRTFSTDFPDGNVPMDFLAADVDESGGTNASDQGYITDLAAGSILKAKDILGNWTKDTGNSPYSLYKEFSFSGVTPTSDIVLVINGTFDADNFMVDVVENNVLRVWVKRVMPIEDTEAIVIFSNSGSAKQSVMTADSWTLHHQKKVHVTAATILSTGWNWSANMYPTFNQTYKPADCTVQLEYRRTGKGDAEAYAAYKAADIIVFNNMLFSLGTVPSIDIPVYLTVIPK